MYQASCKPKVIPTFRFPILMCQAADRYTVVTASSVPSFLAAFTDDRVGVIQVTQSLNISLPLDAVLARNNNLTIQV